VIATLDTRSALPIAAAAAAAERPALTSIASLSLIEKRAKELLRSQEPSPKRPMALPPPSALASPAGAPPEKKESDAKEFVENLSQLAPLPCRTPAFRGQRVIVDAGRHDLDCEPGCALVLVDKALDAATLDEYLRGASQMRRVSGRAGFGMKPRRELCYSAPDEGAYKYSGTTHATVPYPMHVLRVADVLFKQFQRLVPDNPFTRLSHGIDIIYSAEFPRGGSVAAHADNEQPWGLVLIFSLGQTRWLRVKHTISGKRINVQMRHNSLLAMSGAAFQRRFTHQVDKLARNERVGIRLSLNLRYGLPHTRAKRARDEAPEEQQHEVAAAKVAREESAPQ
jgi:hypothetical protein